MSLIDSALLAHPRQNELYRRLGSAGDRPVCFTAAIAPCECVETPRITRGIQCVIEDKELFDRCSERSEIMFEHWAAAVQSSWQAFRVWRERAASCHSGSLLARHDTGRHDTGGHPEERYVTIKTDADCIECWKSDQVFTQQLIELHKLAARALSAAEDARSALRFIDYPRYENGQGPGVGIHAAKDVVQAGATQSAPAMEPREHGAASGEPQKHRGKSESRR